MAFRNNVITNQQHAGNGGVGAGMAVNTFDSSSDNTRSVALTECIIAQNFLFAGGGKSIDGELVGSVHERQR